MTEPAASLAMAPVARTSLPAILEIERASFSDPWTQGMFQSELDSGTGTYARCALRAGRLVGYLFAVIVMDEAHLGNLAVHPGERRRGIGQALLEDLLAEARRRGLIRVTLEVRESNESARNFYRCNGFIDVAIRKNYYRRPVEDAIVMLLSLPEASSG